jgi:hypothetical protein
MANLIFLIMHMCDFTLPDLAILTSPQTLFHVLHTIEMVGMLSFESSWQVAKAMTIILSLRESLCYIIVL